MIAIDSIIVSTLMATVVRAATAAGFVALMVVTIGPGPWASESQVFDTQRERFRVNTLVRGLEHPWSLAFLPGGDMLITERPGRLLRVDGETRQATTVRGLPAIAAIGQGGLLDVTLHPEFASNRLIYISFSGADDNGAGT